MKATEESGASFASPRVGCMEREKKPQGRAVRETESLDDDECGRGIHRQMCRVCDAMRWNGCDAEERRIWANSGVDPDKGVPEAVERLTRERGSSANRKTLPGR